MRSSCGGIALSLVLALLTATAADAVRVVVGNGPLLFGGGFAPSKLPRERPQPISLGVELRAPRSATPTRITGLRLEFPPSVTLDSDGLPTCSSSRIRDLSLERAGKTCGPAMVGEGSFVPRLSIPENAMDCFGNCAGSILAFNSTSEGRPAILLAAALGAPIPDSFSVVLRRAGTSGGFTTSLAGTVPQFAQGYGSLSSLHLRLQRRFRVDDERRSYISARCPAPNGFSQVNLVFARIAYTLDDGHELSSKLVRRCTVRNEE